MVKKHIKTTKEKKGGIVSKENFVHFSNLIFIDKSNEKNKRLAKNDTRLKDIYKKIQPELKEKFGFKNIYMTPKLSKVVINMGLGSMEMILKFLNHAKKICQKLQDKNH